MDRFEATSMMPAVADADSPCAAAHKTSLATVVADAPVDFIAAHLRGIVGAQIPVARFEGKRKISPNRPEIDRVGVMAGLAASETPRDRKGRQVHPACRGAFPSPATSIKPFAVQIQRLI